MTWAPWIALALGAGIIVALGALALAVARAAGRAEAQREQAEADAAAGRAYEAERERVHDFYAHLRDRVRADPGDPGTDIMRWLRRDHRPPTLPAPPERAPGAADRTVAGPDGRARE